MKVKLLLIAVFVFLLSALPVSAFDPPHNAASGINCGGCHGKTLDIEGGSPFWTGNTSEEAYNSMCCRCHVEPPSTGDSETGFCGEKAPLVQTHAPGDPPAPIKCTVCHHNHEQEQIYPGKYNQANFFIAKGTRDADEDLLVVDVVSGEEVFKRTVIPYSDLYATDSSSKWAEDLNYLATKTEQPGGVEKPGRGALLVPDITATNSRWPAYMICAIDTDNKTITVKGELADASNLGIFYGQQVRAIMFVDAELKFVEFYDIKGNYSFINDSHTGICQVCHENTKYWLNDGSGDDHFDVNCMNCHKHTNGFEHGGGAGEDCIGCHNTGSHVVHLDADDPRGPAIFCDECHDFDNMPYFKSGDGTVPYDLSETTVCDTCHSPGGSYDGVDDADIGAKTNWESGIYESDKVTLQSGKDKWCATCHDEEPAQVQSVEAPNVIGDEDGVYIYGNGWGYYKTGHGLAGSETFPSKGGIETLAGRPIECDACHDYSTSHIDGEPRTFGCGDGCDSMEYRTSYRLKTVQGQEPMEIPWTGLGGSTPEKFRICTQAGCHAPDPFTDPDNTDTNLYTWRAVKVSSNPDVWEYYWENRHEYHLNFPHQNRYPADYNYEGTYNSRITCVNCHNVHGSTQLAMVRDGKLIGREPGLKIWYDNPDMVSFSSTNTNPPDPENIPLSASTGTIWRGGTSSNLCTHCHGNNNTISECRNINSDCSGDVVPPFQSDYLQGPTLDWTGESGYQSDGADPDSAATGSSFTFRVKYIDTNNDSPSSIQVWIDENNNGYDAGEKHNLSEMDSGDVTYYDGKLYTISRTLTNTVSNLHPYRFYAVSNGVDAIGPPVNSSSVYVLDSSAGSGDTPTLAWTGEENFTADGVHPDEAFSGSSFEFRVEYGDAENDPPARIELWIDEDRNGAYSSDEKYIMTEDGGGANYAAGRFFTENLTLTCEGGCTMNYRFHATDGASEAADLGGTVTVLNNVPVLAWTGETNYTADGVNPDSGAGGTDFAFRVKYTDADNTAPAAIQVWVDTDNSGTYDVHEKFSMNQDDDDGDALYTNGEKYSKTVQVPYVGDGAISYRFYASDGIDSAVSNEPVDDTPLNTSAPTVNSAPILSWTTADCLNNGVRPPRGGVYSDFEFKVIYTDTDPSQCAVDVLLLVDEDDDSIYNSDEKYILTGDAGDSDCTDGRLYETTVTLDFAGDGEISYRFYATDGFEPATGIPVTNDSSVTMVNSLNVRPAGGSGWYSTIQDAIDASGNGAAVLVYPEADYTAHTYVENVSLMDKDDRTLLSACGPDLTIISSFSTGHTVITQGSSNFVLDGFSLTGATNSSGGIWINGTDGSQATIQNSKMYGNSNGIAINSANDVPVVIDNVEIYDNDNHGIYLVNSACDANISNSEIHSHNVSVAGAGIYTNSAALNVSNTIIRNNTTSTTSGAIHANGAAAVVTIEDSEIYGNQASNGGAIYLNTYSSLIARRSVFRNNTSSGTGGAIYSNGCDITAENIIFAGNTASSGGVMLLNNSPIVTITNSTFADNQATPGDGGAIWTCAAPVPPADPSTTIRNSIFWGNTAAGAGNNFYKGCGGYANYLTISDSDADLSFPEYAGGKSLIGTGNMINEDPIFVGGGNYHLQAGSPVIDQANAVYAPDDDIDGGSRPQGSGYDMGADEYGTP